MDSMVGHTMISIFVTLKDGVLDKVSILMKPLGSVIKELFRWFGCK